MRRIAIAFIAFLLPGAMAHAQAQPAPAPAPSTAAPPPVTSESHALAARVIDMTGADRDWQQFVAVMRTEIIQFVMRNSGKSQEESAKIVDEVLMPDFTSQENDLTNAIIDVWASNFSVEDLQGLIDFYSTPLGKRLITTLPSIAERTSAVSGAWGRQIYQRALQKHKDELIARGVRL
jgi:hypothetical protein